MEAAGVVFIVVVIFLLIVLSAAIKVVKEYERGVVFRLGRLVGPRGPGLILLIPFIERMVKVDLRTVTMDVPSQEVITRDNVTVRVNAVAYFRVVDPNAAVVNVADYIRATSQISQTTLRSVLGQSSLDELLSEREQINQQLQMIIDDQTEPWGIKVSVVEVKDVELPQSMQRAMARQAEAEREKRAKIIHAEGEFQASQQLAEAADVINRNPVTIQLRYLQTLTEIGAEKNTTIVFPLPIDLLGAMIGAGGTEGRAPSVSGAPVSPPSPSPSIGTGEGLAGGSGAPAEPSAPAGGGGRFAELADVDEGGGEGR
jgi:regulator of protease activity HflC (stomatin/prohibitin superfamily)